MGVRRDPFALLCVEVVRFGPLTLERPRTVLSHALRVQQDSEPYIFFLRWVAQRVPPGATIAVRTPEQPNVGPQFLIAVGQLPRHNVWPDVSGPGGTGPLADWVAGFFFLLDDPRYERVDTTLNGALYRKRP